MRLCRVFVFTGVARHLFFLSLNISDLASRMCPTGNSAAISLSIGVAATRANTLSWDWWLHCPNHAADACRE
ncbi:uncharacterized protein ASPGLDRAFT_45058 [Aspergillus glaucus CBS 516.65]|uniref:Secreted protein n=1 Tax=Aspergillus glaucus CBS 516.65 TaxID=1160497 RepID=A0A1L9VQ59_ASPGL|nr:hypothetical protein ASPGLDRAFT_45058 [Aspergillus glaucus CBS 516.65]OJJ86049.1 hypothetical protein ASPGLDRAFT_45058 [Aspergillus glaucus CBS 516.65]